MNYWNNERLNLLKSLYPSSSRDVVLSTFPERNWNAIAAEATRRKFSRRVPCKYKKKTYPTMDEVTKTAVAWSIALEGSLMLHKQAHYTRENSIGLYPSMSVGNTNFTLVNKLAQMTGFGFVHRTTYHSKDNGKPVRKWDIRSIPELYAFLIQIVSYLPAKQEQATLLIEYLQGRLRNWKLPYTKRDFEIQQGIQKLNKRGLR